MRTRHLLYAFGPLLAGSAVYAAVYALFTGGLR